MRIRRLASRRVQLRRVRLLSLGGLRLMAQLLDSGPSLIVSREAEKREIIAWYRDMLARTVPPQGGKWEPIKIGPTWQWSEKSGWLLPEFSLGWELLAWSGMWLNGK